MTTLSITVNTSGNLLTMLSVHSVRNSSLWFFFIMIALRKGAIRKTVASPQTAFPVQWHSSCRHTGSTKVNIRNMQATDRMLYSSTFHSIAVSSGFHSDRLFSVAGTLIDECSIRLTHRRGSLLTSRLYAGVAARIMYGVMNVVITETATTTGYRKLLITCSDNPRLAMMNANSPICAMENPHFIAVLSRCPLSQKPSVPKMAWPIMMVSTRATIGPA